MQQFLETAAPTEGDLASGVVQIDHPSYLEFLTQANTDPSVWFSSYVLKIDEDRLAAATCWGQRFDPLVAEFSKPHGPAFMKELRKIWPTFFELIDNSVDERYGDGALTEVVDPEDMNRKWVIAILVGGLKSEADWPRVLEAVDRAVALSLTVGQELQHELSKGQKVKVMLAGGRAGYRQGKEATAPWEKRLGWLKTILGS